MLLCSFVNMKRLTEEMVIARTKISDLSQIKRLNCWGSELTDVSLLRRMNSVEVLSLSINKINSLVDFQYCRGLQELYIRQNNIKDLNEICYLQDLPNLRNLWLGENPCAKTDGYRLTVIRALPQLQKLDDVSITPEELAEANRRGQSLIHPEDEDHNSQADYYQNKGSQQITSRRSTPEISPTRVEPTRQSSYDPDDDQDYYTEADEVTNERRVYNSPSGKESPPRRHDSSEHHQQQQQQQRQRTYSPERETSPVYYEDRRNANTNYESGSSPKQSRQYQHYDDYTNGDRYQNYHQSTQSMTSNYRQQNDGGSDGSNNGHYDYQPHPGSVRQSQSQRDVRDRCERASCTVNHRPPFHRRPVTRNSNILSAVLCLVKELDYPSLEVVEMAVRCRMDELED